MKAFAQAKGIYGMKLGFLNGIALVIMVAHVLQKYLPRIVAQELGSFDMMVQAVIVQFF